MFYKSYEVDADPENSDDDGKRRVARASAVFNCARSMATQSPLPFRIWGLSLATRYSTPS